MIIIDRKQILKVISFLAIFVFAYTITKINVNNKSENNASIQTVALPTNKKVIVIDARTWSAR